MCKKVARVSMIFVLLCVIAKVGQGCLLCVERVLSCSVQGGKLWPRLTHG